MREGPLKLLLTSFAWSLSSIDIDASIGSASMLLRRTASTSSGEES